MGIGARPRQFTITPSGADSTALAAGLGNTSNVFTVDASVPDDFGYIISIDNVIGAFDLSARTLTIVGLDSNGSTQTETISGPGAGDMVYSTLYYTYISTITVSGGSIEPVAFDIGISANAISKSYPITWAASNLEVNVSTEMEGYQVQYTRTPNISDVNSNEYIASTDWIWVDWAATQEGVYQILYPPVNIRFLMTSYTDGQSLSFNYSQSRIY